MDFDAAITKWIDNYDELKYPTGIYHELVVEGKEHDNKIILLGAWKTGCLRIEDKGNDYQDQNGYKYKFTKRWKGDAPVGFNVWNDISNNQELMKNKIPIQFPSEMPTVVKELLEHRGFGFIWAVFVLHCFYPHIYPLYDQHVYRAYKSIESDGKDNANTAPNNWIEYSKYKSFFDKKLIKLGIKFWELDRALWSYGKAKKQKVRVENTVYIKSVNTVKSNITDYHWLHLTTLGPKAKSFWWHLDENYNLYVKRRYKKSIKYVSKKINCAELIKIDQYMNNHQWVDLSNNVTKLRDDTEKDGLGKFLYCGLGWNTTDAQLASHLSAIFTLSGVWDFNQAKIGMKFIKNNVNWKETIKQFYLSELLDESN